MREIKFEIGFTNHAPMVFTIEQLMSGGLMNVLAKDVGTVKYKRQYTCLNDKNGKEIYEGDVIKFNYPNGGSEVIGSVHWSKGGAYYIVRTKDKGFNDKVIPYPCLLEVIGNIHEHSHLLDEKK